MASVDELRLMYLAAQMYYLEDKIQSEIAEELGISRPKVSRLLSQARDEGMIRVTVTNPFANLEVLSDALKQQLGLSSAMVVPGVGGAQPQIRKRVGAAAARYLEKSLQKRDVLGIGWGRTLYEVAIALEEQSDLELTVVPLLGGLGQIVPSFQVHSLARMICEKLGGTWLPLYVPAIIEDRTTLESLLASRDMVRIVEAWDDLTVALVGVGVFDLGPDFQMLFADYLDEDTLGNLEKAEAVGDICMHYFDIHGNYIVDGVPNAVSIDLESFKRVPRRIAVAGGVEKAEAIIGTVRGSDINILITDESAACRMLEIIDDDRS